MKRILVIIASLLLLQSSFAQTKTDYDQLWKKAEELRDKKGLIKSAIDQSKKIYDIAKKEKNDVQQVKALLFQLSNEASISEDGQLNTIAGLEKEISTASQPSRSILQSIAASAYLEYLNNNRWKFYNRTETKNFDKKDIATWSPGDFHKKIGQLYLSSIKETNLLQDTKLEKIDPIIIKGNTRKLRPTLFDLLAFRALEYFTNDERDITKPAYAFKIDMASAFDPAADFVKWKFSTNDSTSLYHKALLIYQQVLSFHLNDKTPDALIDADLARLKFVNEYSVHPDKKNLYRLSLEHIGDQYGTIPAATEAWYRVARIFADDAGTYKPFEDTTYRMEYLKAVELCNKVVALKDSSEGKMHCLELLQSITQKTLVMHTEKVNLPGQPFRTLVNYSNIDKINLRIIKVDKTLRESLEDNYNEKYWSQLVKQKPERRWQQALPLTHDYQEHSTEIKIDALPAGEYALMASIDEQFSVKENMMAVQFFYVSNISYINSGTGYFVLNRNTGQPLNNATVQVYEKKYDYSAGKYLSSKKESYITDKNGYFKLQNPNSYSRNIRLDITWNNDRLFLNDESYSYNYNNAEPQNREWMQTFFFTDRGIYRPGQTVYFKGILIAKNTDDKKTRIVPNTETVVQLYDANYQLSDSIRVRTNEFGSYSGKLILPKGLLNGSFRLHDIKGASDQYFRVEEYKRPKFYVEFEKIKGSYRVNDSIEVIGKAKAYAGNNIDGAEVKFRVKRMARFIYPLYKWGWWPQRQQAQEISNGIIKTNKDGSFRIRFKALPDESISKKEDPLFDYAVNADVTDINGETRIGNTNITASYKSLFIKTDADEKIPADSLRKIYVSTSNQSGEFEAANLNITVYQSQQPNRLIRARLWERADQYTMSREEYLQHFPYDNYEDDDNPYSWKRDTVISNLAIATKEKDSYYLLSSRLPAGIYFIEFSGKDKYGEEIKAMQQVELFQKSGDINSMAYWWNDKKAAAAEPGEKAAFNIATGADDLFVIRSSKDTGQKTGESSFEFLQLNNEKKTITIIPKETDRGGINFNLAFVKHNRFFNEAYNVVVPWTNKELKISVGTYRDKTEPGSQEKWKVKISGYKGDKVTAELLTTMYDASLDQFSPYQWNKPALWRNNYFTASWNSNNCFAEVGSAYESFYSIKDYFVEKSYDALWWQSSMAYRYNFTTGKAYGVVAPNVSRDGINLREADMAVTDSTNIKIKKELTAQTTTLKSVSVGYGTKKNPSPEASNQQMNSPGENVTIRKNFNETAFFFPDLRTDSSGNIEFSFTMPEALTRWKWMMLGHTKDLRFGYEEKSVITQKTLMLQPNSPRFLREGDKIIFSAKIVNMSDKEMTGVSTLQMLNTSSGLPVDTWFRNISPTQYFTVAAGQSTTVNFSLDVPVNFNDAVTYRITAISPSQRGNKGEEEFSDGEEMPLPVLTNRMLVTETLPVYMRGTGTKKVSFSKLKDAPQHSSLTHYNLAVEYTSNPAWYVVQALPYLMEYPYECAEQTFNRFYANVLAASIMRSSPRIQKIFTQWKNTDTAALMSNLQKNEELKSALLQETPWVLEAKSEEQQKKNIAFLFDLVRLANESSKTLQKLAEMQSPNGGFVWFKGGPDDRYITQYILTGIGHLKKLNALTAEQNRALKPIIDKAIPYLDAKLKADYDQLVKSKTKLTNYNLGNTQVQYLYMRSFFPEYPRTANNNKAYSYYYGQAKKYWLRNSLYMQAMIALVLNRSGEHKVPRQILASAKEKAILKDEMGMYWKEMNGGYFWYQAPIESMALMIEAFGEINNDMVAIDDMKTWLLKNKQTNNWKTTRATAEACYAFLLRGSDLLSASPNVEIDLGEMKIKSSDEKLEAGTGYLKHSIPQQLISNNMGDITLTVSPSNEAKAEASSSSWGAVYWQYFEDLDKITPAETPLKLTKKLFIETNSDNGAVLTAIKENDVLKVGDKIKVRIELRADRDMEYIHMKDMRASCMEPVNVISAYKWQGGLGYYESTKDASTNFFFSWLPRGTYVFEYPVFVTHEGNFSNGISSIQCMYAPEFSAHSEGIRVKVE